MIFQVDLVQFCGIPYRKNSGPNQPERVKLLMCSYSFWKSGSFSGRISIDPTAREDVTLVPVPRECIGYVMGDKSGCSDTKHQTAAGWNSSHFTTKDGPGFFGL